MGKIALAVVAAPIIFVAAAIWMIGVFAYLAVNNRFSPKPAKPDHNP